MAFNYVVMFVFINIMYVSLNFFNFVNIYNPVMLWYFIDHNVKYFLNIEYFI